MTEWMKLLQRSRSPWTKKVRQGDTIQGDTSNVVHFCLAWCIIGIQLARDGIKIDGLYSDQLQFVGDIVIVNENL